MPRLRASLASPSAAPALMLAGVALVALAVLGSALGELTGVALIALGAGVALTERVSPARRFEWLILHTGVYALLYVLFLAGRAHAHGATPLLVADAACSVIFLALLARLAGRGR